MSHLDVSLPQNSFHNGQQIDLEALTLEQNYENGIDESIIQNHFGSGILLDLPTKPILFDSNELSATSAALLAAGNFDGTGISPLLQPSDINLGNQLEIELTGANVVGRHSIKVAVIGLDFNGVLQSERFYFYKNEIQVTRLHYKEVLSFLFNDFKGNHNCSRNFGGQIVIREATSFEMSRDAIMISQDVQPDLFWRDFKIADPTITLLQTLQNAIGLAHDPLGLGIDTSGQPSQQLLPNDVIFKLGEKFQAKTNQIQKITFLLGVSSDSSQPFDQQFDWTGDLVISIYPLETVILAPSEIIPELAIEFDPEPVPLAQLSFNQAALKSSGYILTDVLQPVDFVFSNTKIANASLQPIEVDKYYVVTLNRSGASNTGILLVGNGLVSKDNTRMTMFSSSGWIDLPENNLWFQIWTDAVKLSSGQAYDNGKGIISPKTIIDSLSAATIDYIDGAHSLLDTGENTINFGVVQALSQESQPTPSLQTGTSVNLVKQNIPSFSFVNLVGLTELKQVSDPLIVGVIKDINPKNNPLLTKIQPYVGMAATDNFCIISPDADLLSLNLVGSKLIPNILNCNADFLVVKSTICTDGYGDLDGNGVIDLADQFLMSQLIGESLFFQSTQQKIIDGDFTTLNILRADLDGDGYITNNDGNLLNDYITKQINSFPVGTSFTHLCLEVQNSIGRYDGYFDCNVDGYFSMDGYGALIPISGLSLSQLQWDGYEVDPNILLDSVFTTLPFAGVTYQIKPLPTWHDYNLLINSNARETFTTFSYPVSNPDFCAESSISICQDLSEINPIADPGRNDYYVPGNLILAKNGQLILPDGDYYKIDFEIGLITLELPQVILDSYGAIFHGDIVINLFDAFVAENPKGSKLTRKKYPAMSYADCSKVQIEDLFLNRIRFGVSIESLTPNPSFDGYIDGYAQFFETEVGVYLDPISSILTVSPKDIVYDPLFPQHRTTLLIQVFLKKAGWNNPPLTVTQDQIFGLIAK